MVNVEHEPEDDTMRQTERRAISPAAIATLITALIAIVGVAVSWDRQEATGAEMARRVSIIEVGLTTDRTADVAYKTDALSRLARIEERQIATQAAVSRLERVGVKP